MNNKDEGDNLSLVSGESNVTYLFTSAVLNNCFR